MPPSPDQALQLDLQVVIDRVVDEAFPGFVEATFQDALGATHRVTDKLPVLSAIATLETPPALPWGDPGDGAGAGWRPGEGQPGQPLGPTDPGRGGRRLGRGSQAASVRLGWAIDRSDE